MTYKEAAIPYPSYLSPTTPATKSKALIMGILLEEKKYITWSRTTFDGWQRYPANLSNYDRNIIDGDALNQELTVHSERLFCGKASGINVDIFDIEGLWCSREAFCVLLLNLRLPRSRSDKSSPS